MRPKIAQIKIAEPCSESWEEMTPDNQGKQCAKCSKAVVDFTQMSDNAIVEYLRKNKQACGRFYDHQVDRDFMLYPETPKWRNGFGKVAAGVLLLSYFFPKKAQANVQDNYAVISSFTNGIQQDSAENSKSFKGKITQPVSPDDRAIKLVFTMDIFKMEIVCDSLSPQEFNFHLPDNLKGEMVVAEIMTSDTIYSFSVYGSGNSDSVKHLFRGIHSFYFDKGWKYIELSEEFNFSPVLGPYITMGIPYIPFQTQPLLKGEWDTLVYSLGNVTLDTFAIDTPVVKDSAWLMKLKKEKEVFKASLKKDHIWNWWWAVFALSLSFLIRWFFAGQNTNKQIENQE